MPDAGPSIPVAVLEETPRFGVGAVLSRSFSVWLSNLPLFLGISLAFHLPLIFVRGVLPAGPVLRRFGWVAVTTLLGFVVSGAVIRGVVEQLRGGRAGLADSLQVAFRSLPRVVVTGFVAGVVIAFASLLLVVPGAVMSCSYFVVVPAAVIERTPPFKSLARSSELTDGYRWHLFGLFLVSRLLGAAIGLFAVAVFARTAGLTRAILMTVLPTAIATSLQAVFEGVAYYQLRVAKEGIDIEQLAAVFD